MPEASARDVDPVVASARDGDVGAFETLVRTNADAVYAHALRFFGDRQLAEDATQEVFLKVFRSLAGFDGRSSFTTWLFRLTRNVCIDMLRRNRRSPMPVDPLEGAQAVTPDFSDGVLTSESLERAIATLQPEDRDALSAVTLFGLSYQDAAAALGVPVGTVKSRVFRARRLILGLLGLAAKEA
ncbi:MAG TPA: RNA polymerase sigma factor [Coriobacteriia bacterium]